MRSLIIAIPLMLFAALLQATVINRLGAGAARPNLALVLALAWTMRTFLLTGNPIYPAFFGVLGA